MEEGYIHKAHAGLEGKTPYLAYQENSKKIRFTSNEECRQVFLWEETRRVDRTGAAKLKGFAYDIGISLIRKTVDLRFDPFDLSIVEVWHNGIFVKKAEKLTFPEFLGQTPSCAPKHASVNNSRLLDAYGNMHALREKQKNAAISFIDMEEDDHHV